MRKVMSYYNHKGTNGSAAMMFEKCFPGQVKWVSIKAKSDEIKWKSRAKQDVVRRNVREKILRVLRLQDGRASPHRRNEETMRY